MHYYVAGTVQSISAVFVMLMGNLWFVGVIGVNGNMGRKTNHKTASSMSIYSLLACLLKYIWAVSIYAVVLTH